MNLDSPHKGKQVMTLSYKLTILLALNGTVCEPFFGEIDTQLRYVHKYVQGCTFVCTYTQLKSEVQTGATVHVLYLLTSGMVLCTLTYSTECQIS